MAAPAEEAAVPETVSAQAEDLQNLAETKETVDEVDSRELSSDAIATDLLNQPGSEGVPMPRTGLAMEGLEQPGVQEEPGTPAMPESLAQDQSSGMQAEDGEQVGTQSLPQNMAQHEMPPEPPMRNPAPIIEYVRPEEAPPAEPLEDTQGEAARSVQQAEEQRTSGAAPGASPQPTVEMLGEQDAMHSTPAPPINLPQQPVPGTGTVVEPHGYLLARIFTARNAVPVPNATVTITRHTDNGEELLAVIRTDEDGRTRQVELPAPAASLSESPGTFEPFAKYDVRIEREGFYTVIIKDVQVFDEQTSLQEVEMVPLPEYSGPLSETFTVTPQEL